MEESCSKNDRRFVGDPTSKGTIMRSLKSKISLASVLAIAISGVAQAAPGQQAARGQSSTGKNCWGVVSAQLAHVEGGIGEHSSCQATPRLGLGNVARLFYDLGLIDDPSVSDLGSLLAQLDEYDETVCPVQ